MDEKAAGAYQYFQAILRNLNINLACIDQEATDEVAYDGGIRELVYADFDYRPHLREVLSQIQPNTVYRIHDELQCNYVLFIHPELPEYSIMLIGPYKTEILQPEQICAQAAKLSIDSSFLTALEEFYKSVPLVYNETVFLTLISSYGETIWGSIHNFSFTHFEKDLLQLSAAPHESSTLSASAYVHLLEQTENRYALENQFLDAVSHGNLPLSELYFEKLKRINLNRDLQSVPDIQNYAQLLNVLLRKAVETGGVHAFFIEEVYTEFTRRIGLLTSAKKADILQHAMITDYCELVAKHSTRRYAPIIRRIISYIDMNITDDLSLRNLSALFHVDRKHLSKTFHANTGLTLTKYVHHRRLERAVLLLKSTALPVRTIAQYSGIDDLNYFSRLFRERYGVSPSEFRTAHHIHDRGFLDVAQKITDE